MNAAMLLLKRGFLPHTNATITQAKKHGHKGIPMGVQRAIAMLSLVLISPVMLLVMLCIKLESRGPIFFTQVRIGAHGRRFHCFKLRSMYLKTDPKYREPDPTTSSREGVCKKYINDPRITRMGRIIRKLSIDEIPQLFNVARGDMALIGPRPPLVCEFNQYDNTIYPRLHCHAGLTGLWQVSGRADTTFEEQLALDKQYVQQQSIWFDVSIVLKTIPAVLMAKGAY